MENSKRYVVICSTGRTAVYYGCTEDGTSCEWQHTFFKRPTPDAVYALLEALINKRTDERILNGFVWNGKGVYLSTENQFNFKAAYDLAVQTGGATLPIKFKLGEQDGMPVYHVFEDMESFSDFYQQAIAFIVKTLNDGWEEKDSVKEWIVEQLKQ